MDGKLILVSISRPMVYCLISANIMRQPRARDLYGICERSYPALQRKMTTLDYASTTSLVSQLREVGRTIQAGIEEYIAELEKATSGSSSAPKGRQSPIPPHSVFEAQKFLINATGRLNSVLLSPKEQLVLLSGQHLEARALHIIAAADVAGIIERQGAGRGMSIRDLARETGLEEGKLGKSLKFVLPQCLYSC